MASATQISLIVFSGIAIAGGQGCMTLYARGLPEPPLWPSLLQYTVAAWPFYAFVLLYGGGMLSMVWLLRSLPLAQVSISVLAITILCSTALTVWLGGGLSGAQLLGIVLVFVGLCLLQLAG